MIEPEFKWTYREKIGKNNELFPYYIYDYHDNNHFINGSEGCNVTNGDPRRQGKSEHTYVHIEVLQNNDGLYLPICYWWRDEYYRESDRQLISPLHIISIGRPDKKNIQKYNDLGFAEILEEKYLLKMNANLNKETIYQYFTMFAEKAALPRKKSDEPEPENYIPNYEITSQYPLVIFDCEEYGRMEWVNPNINKMNITEEDIQKAKNYIAPAHY